MTWYVFLRLADGKIFISDNRDNYSLGKFKKLAEGTKREMKRQYPQALVL